MTEFDAIKITCFSQSCCLGTLEQ